MKTIRFFMVGMGLVTVFTIGLHMTPFSAGISAALISMGVIGFDL